MYATLRRMLLSLAVQPFLVISAYGVLPTIESLGNIDPATVSGDGSTVVGLATFGQVWKRGTPGFADGPSIAMWEVSHDGSFFPDSWTPHPSWEAAGNPNGMPWPISFLPYGLSGDGTTYSGFVAHNGDIWSATQAQAATYSEQGGLAIFGELVSNFLAVAELPLYGATGISSDGSVVVGTQRVEGQDVAYRWTQQDGVSVLGVGHGANISPDGSTIVGVSNDSIFKWTAAEGVVPLGGSVAGGIDWVGVGVSFDGSRIVGGDLFWSAATGSRPIEEVLSQWYGLELDGWGTLYATDISDDGRTIVGQSLGGGWLVTLPELGDANGDNFVDGGDYSTWADNFLHSDRHWSTGDFNGDGFVDAADYTIWADNYSPFDGLGVQAVPEPDAFAIACCGLLSCLVTGAFRRFRRTNGTGPAAGNAVEPASRRRSCRAFE